ncbi:MAG: 50S ribosomal protein L23 [Bacteroidetes bacterium RIFOXYA12_FULL_35_11]|nr:MAG: 50S ribosomal protein L23 [Bacteroidetes bacterium GWF2_35_48]OFY79597.1 MAG: 50S ribosomal protein L23 [Bacteroidetes bacterium RIFOXYA12_FULL_35_11]OFY99411.1 MAG: 50S ribosomal protein L23 [Bacteroidetes bacterium RIFOXYC12_FULL_35_7]HBX50548.1 50S ribosomal protein L23 [Bacteroidales bacterium]
MNILVRPIVTEKMTLQGDKLNRYAVIVEKTANKLQIKKAIQDMYGVTVKAVNTQCYLGKAKSRFTKTGVISGRSNSFKKAIITLSKDDKLDFFSNI